MEFRRKMKTRLYVAIIFVALGVMMTAGAIGAKIENGTVSSFGIGMAVYGLARIKQYFYITSNEDRLKKQEIMEKDERNISIANKARSVTFTIFIALSYLAVVILSLFNFHRAAEWITYSLLAFIVIYLVTYVIIRKRS